jgi:hypothetical protein
MSLSGSKSRLVAITNELSVLWKETANYWRDAKSQEFEREFLQELFSGVDRSVTVIEKLDALLKKVRDDCE